MTHEIRWLKQDRVLYVSYQGYQTSETLKTCLDDIAAALDTVDHPLVVLINWVEVTQADKNVLRSQAGHRTYSHPMAARSVLVGFNPLEVMMNETTAINTRGSKNTQYFQTMDEAMEYLQPMLE
jgi:hypothetical protein